MYAPSNRRNVTHRRPPLAQLSFGFTERQEGPSWGGGLAAHWSPGAAGHLRTQTSDAHLWLPFRRCVAETRRRPSFK